MEWNEVYNQILMSALLAVVTFASPFFLKKLFDVLTVWSKDFFVKYSLVYDLAVEAVHFAEQVGLGKLAEEKKDMAIAYLERELAEYGLGGIDLDILADKIEAALFAEINAFKNNIAPTTPKG